MNIELYIDELVLHGFPNHDRYLISAAIENELMQLLAAQGAPPSLTRSGNFNQFDAGEFQMTSGAKAEMVGAQIAQTIYGGLKQ